MAKPRQLSKPPISEAIMHFKFAGERLARESLEALALPYTNDGWTQQTVHSLHANIAVQPEDISQPVVTSDASFGGFVLCDSHSRRFVRLHADSIAVSVTKHYTSWEELEEQARQIFDAYVKATKGVHVQRIATRFINRIPPFSEATQFDQVLTRPPLPLEELPGAHVSDFLRRHVIAGLEDGYLANLTIGTVLSEPDEPPPPAKAIVIDVDVFKDCELEPSFDLVRPHMTKARAIKNELFFGSILETTVERFI